MKKLAILFAVAAIAVSANAQKRYTTTGTKFTDNTYVGVAAGMETGITTMGVNGINGSEAAAFSAFNPNLAIMVGKNFTPVFGLRLEGDVRFGVHGNNCEYVNSFGWYNGGTFLNGLDVNLLGTFNLMNLFGGYKGDPRTFEISAIYGFGWGHGFRQMDRFNTVNSKVGLDFAWNLGKDKEYQLFFEPALNYTMAAYAAGYNTGALFQYNADNAILDLRVGFIYKFKCSNGKHNFAIEQLRDQQEIDALNAKINDLRKDLDACNAGKPAMAAEIAKLKKELADCQNKPVEKKAANLAPSVIFRQGKSIIDKNQMANIEMIANYMKNNKDAKVKILGYASPEGSKEFNQKLSVARANAVKDVLVKKYKIAADRMQAEGLGATDKLFNEVEFNRVVLFNDETK